MNRKHHRLLQAISIGVGLTVCAFGFATDWIVGGAPGIGKLQFLIILFGALVAGLAFLSPIWNARVLLAISSASLCVVICEVILQMTIGNRYRVVHQLDPECIYRYRPGARVVRTRATEEGGQDFWITINSNGFRGPEYSPTADRSTVVVYGDSFVASEFSPWNETFVARLQEQFGDKHEFVNAGVPGYGPDQAAVRLKQELVKLKPRAVILCIFTGNDYGDLFRNRLFRFTPTGDLIRNQVHISHLMHAELIRQERLPILFHLYNNIVQNRHFSQVNTKQHWLSVSHGEFKQFRDSNSNEVTSGSDHYEADIALEPGSLASLTKRRLMSGVLGYCHDLCQRKGTEFVVVAIPEKADILKNVDWLTMSPDYDRRRLTDWIAQICCDLDIKCVNLFEAFDEAGADAYFVGLDNHWNANGQRLAAEEVANRIHEFGILGTK